MRRIRELFRDRAIFSWALYDWANSVFATTVMAGFFPVFFKQYWSTDSDAVTSTAQLGFANSLASAFILVAAPILGAMADSGGAHKKYLGVFTGLGVVMTAGLWFVPEGDWSLAALIYVLATVGFSGSIIFYDALIVSVSPADRVDEVSAFGFSLGYIGGGLLFGLNVAMTLAPATFGLSGPAEAVRLSFLSVAAWWLLFSIPLFRCVPEPARVSRNASAIVAGLRSLVATLRDYRRHRVVGIFLLAYFFYIDGVHTIIRMAVDYGLSLGFPGREFDRRIADHSVCRVPGGTGVRFRRPAVRPETRALRRCSGLRRRDRVRLLHGVGGRVLCACGGGWLGAGRRAIRFAVALCAVRTSGPKRQVLRLLQHARPLRGDHRAGVGSGHRHPHR